MVLEVFGNLARRRAQPERHIGRSNALGGNQNIRLHAPVIHRKPLAGSAPARHHLVGNQQDTVRSQISRSLGIYSGGGTSTPLVPTTGSTITAATSLFVLDHVLEIIRAGDATLRIGVLDGTLVAVHFRRK